MINSLYLLFVCLLAEMFGFSPSSRISLFLEGFSFFSRIELKWHSVLLLLLAFNLLA